MNARTNPILPRRVAPHPAVAAAVAAQGVTEAAAWLEARAADYQLTWLLAHADDGVVWGRVQDGRLLTSHEAARGDAEAESACPALRAATLQQARLFAPHGELLLWRDGDNAWHTRLIRDLREGEPPDAATWGEAFDEPQLLWGTHGRPLPGGFTLLQDGAQGLRHAVPLALTIAAGGAATPPRLAVRHYLNPSGFARVAASRLVDLSPAD